MRPEHGMPRTSDGFATLLLLTLLPARFRSAPMRVAATESTAGTRGLRTRFVDREVAPSDFRRVQLANRRLRLVVGAHFHEGKAAGTARRLVAHHGHRFHGSG